MIPTSKPSDIKATKKTSRMIEWNVQTLTELLKLVIARREAIESVKKASPAPKPPRISGKELGVRPLEEVKDVLELPTFNAKAAAIEKDRDEIALSPKVIEQLRQYVTAVSKFYHDNPFHNFEHASHVASSVDKLLKRIVEPDIDLSQEQCSAMGLHDFTYVLCLSLACFVSICHSNILTLSKLQHYIYQLRNNLRSFNPVVRVFLH